MIALDTAYPCVSSHVTLTIVPVIADRHRAAKLQVAQSGSSIPIEGLSYREFLIAGIFAQTVIFGATYTGAGLAEDMQKGIIDRFRSLPMSRSAVLVGRTSSDIAYNVLSLAIMAGTGLIVGWRIHTSLWGAFAGFLLLLLFAYAFSWVMACVGLLVPSPEVVNNASFMVIFPVTFISNAFVPLENLPGPLRAFAEWNPVSSVTSPGGTRAVRERQPAPQRGAARGVVTKEPDPVHPDLGRGDRGRVSPPLCEPLQARRPQVSVGVSTRVPPLQVQRECEA